MDELDRPKRRRGCTFWLWVALGLVLLSFLTVWLVGFFMPSEYHGAARVTLNQTPQAVWAAIADVEKHPVSASLAKEVKILPPDGERPTWLEELGNSTITVTTVASNEPISLERHMIDSATPMESEWRFEIAPVDAGCVVTVAQHLSLDSGTWHVPYFRFVISVMDGASLGPQEYLRVLAESFGESAEVERIEGH